MVGTLSGIKHVYERLPEAIGVWPCAVIYPREGWLLSGSEWKEDHHLIILEIRVKRGYHPAAEALYRPYIVQVGTLLDSDATIGGSCQQIIPVREGEPHVPYVCGYIDAVGFDRPGEVDMGVVFEIKVKETAR